MGKYVGVLLGNRVHRHSCGDENAGLWIQWVYIQPSSRCCEHKVWTENRV